MTHEYQVSGITCEGCVSKITSLLARIPGVTGVSIDPEGKAKISMSRHIGTVGLLEALKDYPQYQLAEAATPPSQPAENQSFWQTYKPILLLFGYILAITLLIEASMGAPDWMRWMRHFMAGFFLVFSFFKLLNIPAFALSYGSYDLLARRWPFWGYIYPFVELGLGIMFLLNFNPPFTNAATILVMGISSVGVASSLLSKRRFRCACLGAVFNLPMSHITLFEDALMVVMSALMFWNY